MLKVLIFKNFISFALCLFGFQLWLVFCVGDEKEKRDVQAAGLTERQIFFCSKSSSSAINTLSYLFNLDLPSFLTSAILGRRKWGEKQFACFDFGLVKPFCSLQYQSQ